jgi:hypothetical protein
MHRIRLIGKLHTLFIGLIKAKKKRALKRVFGKACSNQRVGTKLAASANTELGTFILTG